MNYGILTFNFLLGILSSFSPCLFPLLPTFMAAQVRKEKPPSLLESIGTTITLMAGLMTVLLLLAFFSTATLRIFFINNFVLFQRIQAILLIILGILLVSNISFGVAIELPQKLEEFIYSDDPKNAYAFAFALGISYTIIAAPCALGYFLALWTTILQMNPIEQLINILVFAAGAGLPFLIVSSIAPSEKMQGFRQKYKTFKLIVGAVLIASGAYLVASSFS